MTGTIRELVRTVNDLKDKQEEWFHRIEQTLALDRSFQEIFNHGLRAHHESLALKNDKQIQWLNTIKADTDLRFPHRKILEFLETQYDHERQDFKEVQLTHLTRRARVSENKASQYLQLLEEKGYIEEKSDGYRRLIRLRNYREE